MSKFFKTPKKLELDLFKEPRTTSSKKDKLKRKGLYGEVNEQILKLLEKENKKEGR